MIAAAGVDHFLDRNTNTLYRAMMELVRARGGDGDILEAREDLTNILRWTLILSDMNGRIQTLEDADAAKKQSAKFSGSTIIASTAAVFEEALTDLLRREPRLAQSAAKVAELYSSERAFALAHSAEENITRRVQKAIAEQLVSGGNLPNIESEIMKIGEENVRPFARSYADTVARTNISTAFNNGRIDQAQDPEVAEVIVALRFTGIEDGRERPNHAAAFGLIAQTGDPIWKKLRPPLGYQCRCGLELVSVFEAERLGLLKNGVFTPHLPASLSQAHPDAGFRPTDISF